MVQFYDDNVELRLSNIDRILTNIDVALTGYINEKVLESLVNKKIMSYHEFKSGFKINLEEVTEELKVLIAERTAKNEAEIEKAFEGRKERIKISVNNLSDEEYRKQIAGLAEQYMSASYAKYTNTVSGVKLPSQQQ